MMAHMLARSNGATAAMLANRMIAMAACNSDAAIFPSTASSSSCSSVSFSSRRFVNKTTTPFTLINNSFAKNSRYITTVTMPSLSPTMEAGKVASWVKKEGDKLNSGDVLATIETDKATMDFQFQDDDMILAKILVPEGTEEVKVGTAVAIVVDNAADLEKVRSGAYTAATATPAGGAAAKPAPAAPSTTPATTTAATDGHSDASALDNNAVMPSARALMASRGVQSSLVKGTGKGGRITKGDVLVHLGSIPASALVAAAAPTTAPTTTTAAAAAPATKTATPSSSATTTTTSATGRPGGGTYKDTKASQVRKVIANRLTESKAKIPHQYAMMDCAIDAMLKLRVTLKDAGINVSVNDMVIKAAARALKDVPEANCYYDPKSDSIKANFSVDVSVAVATDGGLITPIVKTADSMGLLAINEKVKELAGRARANKLKPEEFQGGSFTISNLGMFGIDEFSAVINPPQACILAIGKGEKKVVLPPIKSFDDIKVGAPMPTPTVATMMTVQLSSDARVVDPAIAGQYLQVFRHYVQNPQLLIA